MRKGNSIVTTVSHRKLIHDNCKNQLTHRFFLRTDFLWLKIMFLVAMDIDLDRESLTRGSRSSLSDELQWSELRRVNTKETTRDYYMGVTFIMF